MLEDLLKGEFMEQGEPFYNMSSHDFGVLMFHGLMATPYQVRELGDFLHRRSISNFGACLIGHGTTKKDLLNTTRKDWMDYARKAYVEFNQVYKKTIVLGFSLGGLLALNLAYEFDPAGVISASAPYKVNLGGNLKSMVGFNNGHPDNKIQYPGMFPVKSMSEVLKLAKETREVVPEIDCNLFVTQGTEDLRVSKDSAQLIYDDIGSSYKKIFIAKDEQHIIFKGMYKKEIFNKIHDFILKCI